MVTKRIRSEYMKKFKDPKWETFSKCYEEMLKYRLTRRLLEHSHNPWFWGGSDTDSDSGGRSPTPAGKNQTKEDPTEERELEECAAVRLNKVKERASDPTVVPRLVLAEDENTIQGAAEEVLERKCDGGGEVNQLGLPVLQGKQTQETTGPKSQLTSRQGRSQRVRPLPTQQIKEDSKQNRHPFVLYASGEKDSDIARRKTHNVRPVASTKEIHESALRAKTRREVERQLQSQRAERRRAKSADVDKTRLKVVPPEFNPWLTEYMRCFSARSR
ncbi:centriole, cilia and spindle-associated protein [Boleophthalmus pectinirostris]|uniref:centriole, cilia and spindle-associated protein n=1 Tax=Boleophthalmus pectinirostris TaxID=150288 RepID=UPI000A1C7279|nr:centriole, cilia and spindle-associated protein [Boleophthalmus pectinirostris]